MAEVRSAGGESVKGERRQAEGVGSDGGRATAVCQEERHSELRFEGTAEPRITRKHTDQSARPLPAAALANSSVDGSGSAHRPVEEL